MGEKHTPPGQSSTPAYTLPCPNLPKGKRCPLCGGAYVCLQYTRRKDTDPAIERSAQSQATGGQP